jgi:hypothetical protein
MKTILQLTAAAALLLGGVAYVQADNCVCTRDGCRGTQPWNTNDTPCKGDMYVSGYDSGNQIGVAVAGTFGHSQATAISATSMPLTHCQANSSGSTVFVSDPQCSSAAPYYARTISYTSAN